MKRKNKLPQNSDSKVLSINHIGSKGEGVSYLHTEFNYKKKEYNFFIPFSLPNEIIIARPTHFSSEGIRADLIEIQETSSDRMNPQCSHFFKCGGCLLQHWNFENYSCWKVNKISLPILKISPKRLMHVLIALEKIILIQM